LNNYYIESAFASADADFLVFAGKPSFVPPIYC
jgi:hypothetical protein